MGATGESLSLPACLPAWLPACLPGGKVAGSAQAGRSVRRGIKGTTYDRVVTASTAQAVLTAPSWF
eukprot:scaffold46550_cov17-Tisochrysis_lutea.AAC.1